MSQVPTLWLFQWLLIEYLMEATRKTAISKAEKIFATVRRENMKFFQKATLLRSQTIEGQILDEDCDFPSRCILAFPMAIIALFQGYWPDGQDLMIVKHHNSSSKVAIFRFWQRNGRKLPKLDR